MGGIDGLVWVFGIIAVIVLVRLEKLIKTLKQKGILEEKYKEEQITVPKHSVTVEYIGVA